MELLRRCADDVLEHHRVGAFGHRSHGEQSAFVPHVDDQRLAREHHAGEGRREVGDLGDVAAVHVIDDRPQHRAVGAAAVQDGAREARLLRECGIAVQRVAVAAQPVEQCLLRQRRDLDAVIGGPVGQHDLVGGAALTTEAAFAGGEDRRAGGPQQFARVVDGGVLLHDDRRRTFVPHRVGCGLAVLINFEGKEILKNNFVWVERASSFANFGLCFGCVVCKCACPWVGYFTIITKVPAIIKPAPTAVFKVNVSPKNVIDKIIVRATLSLSMVATCDTLPNCNALK